MSAGQGPNNDIHSSAAKVTLRVQKTYSKYDGPKAVAIDEGTMRAIGAAAGDVVEVQGIKKTLARVLPLHHSDSGRGIARMDEATRDDAGAEVGGAIMIRRVYNIPSADKVILIPPHPMPALDDQYLADELIGVPVTDGSEMKIRFYSEYLHFRVAGVSPVKQSYDRPPTAVVTEETAILLKRKAAG